MIDIEYTTSDLINHFESHKNAYLEYNTTDNIFSISANNSNHITPGALSEQYYFEKNNNYSLKINCKKNNVNAQPFIYISNANNLNYTYSKRTYITTLTATDYIINFGVPENSYGRVNILLGGDLADDVCYVNNMKLNLFNDNYYLKLYKPDNEYNIAIGANALKNNISGTYNTAIGFNALKNNTTSYLNTVCGNNSMVYNTTGLNNCSFGYASLYNNISGNNNCSFGNESLSKNTIGNDNCSVGKFSQYWNINGSANCSFGSFALLYSNGNYNTAIGKQSLETISSDVANTAIGFLAGRYNTGSNNTFLGAYSGSNNFNFNRTTCVGFSSYASGSNRIILGTSYESIHGNGPLNALSDIRDKADIRDTELGLDFINQLRPVDFKYDYREAYIKPLSEKPDNLSKEEEQEWHENNKLENVSKDGSKKRNRYHHGFIAQEVGALNVFGGYKDGVINGDLDIKTLAYEEFIAPLVKAVQELTKMNKELKAEVEELKKHKKIQLIH